MSKTPRTDSLSAAHSKLIGETKGDLYMLGVRATDALRDALALCRSLEEGTTPEGTNHLKWLEDNSTLHKGVEILYVVDGYEVRVMDEDGVTALSPAYHGETLSAAIEAAMIGGRG